MTKEKIVYYVAPADSSGKVHSKSKFACVVERTEELPIMTEWPEHEGPKRKTPAGVFLLLI